MLYIAKHYEIGEANMSIVNCTLWFMLCQCNLKYQEVKPVSYLIVYVYYMIIVIFL